ncbi:hypothetical protein [Paraburkholderia sp. GAS199]|uniref:hypothetical protein n=1 Tax=Paraburkholderia sp. GAS199 TaxID=3035126 RepID=UPI003D1974F5
MVKHYRQSEHDASSENPVVATPQGLPSLQEFWDELASYAFTPEQGQADIGIFLWLQAVAEKSPTHHALMSSFWDAAFDGVARPARPTNG